MPIKIVDHKCVNTGGGCLVDILNLSNGRSLGVTDECIVLYRNVDVGMYNENDEDYGELLVDLFQACPTLTVDDHGSSIKSFSDHSFILNDLTKYEIKQLLETPTTS